MDIKRTRKLLITLLLSTVILLALYNGEQYFSNLNNNDYVKKIDFRNLKNIKGNQNDKNLNDDLFKKVTTVIDNTKLERMNKDYVGWLKIEGTNIDTPVMKSDFYFRRNIKKKYSLAGTPFIPNYNLESIIKPIFGHNLGYGRKDAFHDITKYSNKDFYNTHQTVYFTENKSKGNKYKVVAYLEYSTGNKFDYLNINYRSSKEFLEWKKGIKNISKYSDKNFENIGYSRGKIIILSTCHSTTFVDDGIRSVLICYSPERLKNINVDYYNKSDL